MNTAFRSSPTGWILLADAIGLFPDVAASVFLRRADPVAFFGITGWRIGAGDMQALGILSPETGFVVDSKPLTSDSGWWGCKTLICRHQITVTQYLISPQDTPVLTPKVKTHLTN